MNELFSQEINAVNIGIESFGDNVRQFGAQAIQLEWVPPAQGNFETGKVLAKLMNDDRIKESNETAFNSYLNTQTVLTGVTLASDAIHTLGERMILFAGPPIEWERMCGPVKGAIVGAILYEGWADNEQHAFELAASGEVEFAPCQEHGAVGPMAGIISPSMPVFIVHEKQSDRYSYSNMNEGLGKVLRFGAYNDEVLDRLHWMKNELYPVLDSTLTILGEIELKPLVAQALHMGDEVHNRNAAATGLFLKKIVPTLIKCGKKADVINRAIEFMYSNDHFFLNISMANSKAQLMAAENVPYSSMVTAMGRNGVEFGIRTSGTGEQWFTAPALPVEGLLFPGFTHEDAAPDLGDSVITETSGVGGFAMAASPAIVQFVGGTPADAIANTKQMLHITLGRNNGFTLPPLNFQGTPAGIDARLVVDNSIAPVINTGIAHKEAGVGQIGAGITRAPMECFNQAILALAQTLN